MVENSGLPFPGLDRFTNTSDKFSAYSGKTSKIAFVHCLLVSSAGKGNKYMG